LDLIEYCKDNHVNGSLLFIDFEKAFDYLDWNFIDNALTWFNFGPSFKKWIMTLYSNSESCIINNGYISRYFKVSRGVRQGCPLSPYFFIVCAEILNIIIKNNNTIRGITINNTTFKMSQYADDSVINDGSHETLQEIHIVLEHFATVSGLKVNYDKSYLFPVRGICTSCT